MFKNLFQNIKEDLPASFVVFLVALPLCLGIALASGAPLFSGVISGIVGGIVVGMLSGSALGVSGPAAGLAVIVYQAIATLGSFDLFLVSVIIAGVLQVAMGYLRAGLIAYFFPSSVIHGMLTGIGIIIFLKQLPHAVGYDKDYVGNFAFQQAGGQNTFSSLSNMLNAVSPGVIVVALVALLILIIWETPFFKKQAFAKVIPGPLVAVLTGIGLNVAFSEIPSLAISAEHMVKIPIAASLLGFLGNFTFPNFRGLLMPQIYSTALVLAVIASLETLLSVEAGDKQDPQKRVTPTNRELKAQGIGNIISGLIGGLPITQVVVRSSANQQSGGKTKLSTITHGFLLLVSVVTIPHLLNYIPLGVLASVLLMVGYKLAKPAIFIKMYKAGTGQFIPFMVTVVGVVCEDLLIGIALGLAVALFGILQNNYVIRFKVNKEEFEGKQRIKIRLSEDVTFLNKANLLKTLSKIPNNTDVTIDAKHTKFIHHDIVEIIEDFVQSAPYRDIHVTLIELYDHKDTHPLSNFKLVKGRS